MPRAVLPSCGLFCHVTAADAPAAHLLQVQQKRAFHQQQLLPLMELPDTVIERIASFVPLKGRGGLHAACRRGRMLVNRGITELKVRH